MLNIPSIESLQIDNKKILLRLDLDVDPEKDSLRLEIAAETIKKIKEKNPKGIIIIGSMGRPEGKDESLSLKPVCTKLSEILGLEIEFVEDVVGEVASQKAEQLSDGKIIMLENLRFEKGENGNEEEFAKQLASMGEVYINESFAMSHRDQASIVGIPKLIKHAAGPRFISEVENLSKVFENPKKPVLILISGVKEDKLAYIEPFKEIADKVLVAGRLPDLMGDDKKPIRLTGTDEKLVVADLVQDKEDITIHSMERFEEEIDKARTVVVGGPVGKFEDEGHLQGTERVFKAIAASSALKIAGGGDTEKALKFLNLTDKFDWVSVGGGACLEFLAKKTLPGIEALL